MRFAYADPPYPGLAKKWYSHDERCHEVNHEILIWTLMEEAPDGWALSTSSRAIRWMYPMCPEGTRLMAWVKPFAFTLPHYPKYAWEPVLFWGGRKKRDDRGGRTYDWVSCNPMGVGKGSNPDDLRGRKPREFCHWLFACWGVEPGDTLWDVFEGSGAVSRCFAEYTSGAVDVAGLPLFREEA